MSAAFTASDGARIAYTDDGPGAGAPLLCLAGLTRTGRDFDYLAPHLPETRLIRMDYRGRGGSDWTGETTYTVPREAQDAVELLDHLGLGAAPVLGTSRGGLVGLYLASAAPDRLSGLCLNDVGPEIERAGLEAIFEYVGRPPAAKTHAEAAERMAQTLDGFEGVPMSRWQEEAERQLVASGDGLAIDYDPELRPAFLAAFEGEPPDLWPLFDALGEAHLGPVALIRGANSALLSRRVAGEMRRRRPDMLFAEVPGRGHIPFLDEAESLAVIRDFLARV